MDTLGHSSSLRYSPTSLDALRNQMKRTSSNSNLRDMNLQSSSSECSDDGFATKELRVDTTFSEPDEAARPTGVTDMSSQSREDISDPVSTHLSNDSVEPYERVITSKHGEDIGGEDSHSAKVITELLAMRTKYTFVKPCRYYGSIHAAQYRAKHSAMEAEFTREENAKPMSRRTRKRVDPPFLPISASSPDVGIYNRPPPDHDEVDYIFRNESGVFVARGTGRGKVAQGVAHHQHRSVDQFYQDYQRLKQYLNNGPVKSFAYARLQMLEARFHLHRMLNTGKEQASLQKVSHRDFYNVRKVDTHVHHSACMNAKHLLRFIKYKLKMHPDDIVERVDGKYVTLGELFEQIHCSAYDLSVDRLDMQAGHDTFQRFDRFNKKYNPIGQTLLRKVFLKSDNHMKGRYLAELTRQVFDDLEDVRYSFAEYRISVYGRSQSEFARLGAWYYDNDLHSTNVRWLIQIPRLYSVWKAKHMVHDFNELLTNIFDPLWRASFCPNKYPKLSAFLDQVVGFDCVDDESIPDAPDERVASLPPAAWAKKQNPPYSYWLYYVYANLINLNKFRASKGLSTFSFRPHAGEAGNVNHLAVAYLLAEHINHGINLKRSPVLQYLFILSQIGVAMSPLSNNKLFLDYHHNPFYKFFSRGMNVSLSTDDPLQLHYTKEPLVEEYCVAAQVWKLNSCDLCELARNSVMQSGFEYPFKAHFLGDKHYVPGMQGNDVSVTNVPNIRIHFRHGLHAAELEYIERCIQHGAGPNAPPPPPPLDLPAAKDTEPVQIPVDPQRHQRPPPRDPAEDSPSGPADDPASGPATKAVDVHARRSVALALCVGLAGLATAAFVVLRQSRARKK